MAPVIASQEAHMRLLTTIGVAFLVIGMSASVAHAQAPPRGITSLVPFHLINTLVPPGVVSSAQAGVRDGLLHSRAQA